ncbi:unnamed protein product [Adineta ricciae]|uniref:F-box domain-containing protein n=1 Tax=Adineta ricciae TaxID=249248 RepID=A0A815QMN7_ADIRI|nr:unnamed protein product [Adineta ricciae]CAF1465342.1 unnamed protein product [Adineta ricciae]
MPLPQSAPALSTLPVEILYRILIYLDTETILLSVRYVAKTFYLISNSFNHYHIDFSALSKRNFDIICRLIYPENVVSIILSDEDTTPGQIDLFLTRFRIHYFPHLRSLTFRSIDWTDLHGILTDIFPCSLISFSIHSQGKQSKSTLCLLSQRLNQSNLQSFSLNTYAHQIEGIFKNITESSLTHLTVGTITFNEYQIILRYCPQLRTLRIDDCWISDTDRCFPTKSYRQLTSLTLQDTNRSIEQLEHFLSLSPSIIELKIINSLSTPNSLIDGSKWKMLIKAKLLSLRLFHFVFYQVHLRIYQCDADVEVLIQPFRSSFWLEDKQWFVKCQSIKSLHKVKLFTVPFPSTSYEYNCDPDPILLSTTPRKFNHSTIMKHVRCLSINLSEIKTKLNLRKEDFFFANVTELKLSIRGEWPTDSTHFISMLINVSQLQDLSFQSDFNQKTAANVVDSLTKFIQRISHLRSLSVLPLDINGQYHVDMANLSSIVPLSVEHLTLKIEKLEHMILLIKNLDHLSSVSFNYPHDRKIITDEMIEWLSNSGRDFSHLEREYSLHFWLNYHRCSHFGNPDH